jgi:phosphatidylserine/phosphatidylglycerophosphate/cardiolipin synthase-like enzyme
MSLDELYELSVHDLELLVRAVETGRVSAPVTELGLRAEGLHAFMPHVQDLAVFPDGPSLLAAVRLLSMTARRDAGRPRSQVVWSGPEPIEGRARLTAIVLEQLFASARREVFIAGYSFDQGEAVLEPLHAVMVERGVSAEIVLDCSREKVWQPIAPELLLAKVVERFTKRVWTFGDPTPVLHHDPRTLVREPSHHGGEMYAPVSMHAKCVIVDGQRVLVGSANFSARAQVRNIEVGALLDDAEFAEALLFQWRAAMGHGYVVRVG